MANTSAATFAAQAEQFLGRPYSEIDCRELVNRMLKACGLTGSYKGSNALWRDMAWTGTPEEAVKRFGSVPVGALVYILDFDGGEVLRGYTDGLGNASHVGVVTGTGKGVIHASYSKECVCESEFKGKTIPNEGWNRVGLMKQLDYGISIPASSEQTSASQTDKQPEVTSSSTAVTVAPSGSTVNLRKSASKSAALVERIPLGQTVTLRGPEAGGWYPVRWGKKEGWVMAEFLRVDNPGQAPNVPAPSVPTTEDDTDETYTSYAVIFYDLTREQAEALQADAPMYKSRIEGRNG